MMRPSTTSRPTSQRGAALIMVMFIIGLAVIALVMKSYNAAEMKARQDEKTMKALAEAKEALIAWSVAHSDTPGQMPWPDRRESNNPNYDGRSDCSSTSFDLVNPQGEAKFLGQLPSLPSTTPCLAYSGVGHYQDAYGNKLWYAVSRNLVRKYNSPATNPIINPGILTTSTYPWMVIRDNQNRIVSDRVAAVIVAPGSPLSGQNRSSNTPPASAYLDSIEINGVVYSNADYQVDNKNFIQSPESSTFNDRLIYITIDELIAALAKRVTREVRHKVNFSSNGFIEQCLFNKGECVATLNLNDASKIKSVAENRSISWDKINEQVSVTSQFQCSNLDKLSCQRSSINQSGQGQPITISVTIPLNGVGVGMQSKTVERVRAGGWEIKITENGVTTTIKTQQINSTEQIEIANPDRPVNQVQWPDWYFNNNWDQYTDIVMASGNGAKCGENCFTIQRKNGTVINGMQRVVVVRKNGRVSNVSVPVINESASDMLAISWVSE